MLHSNCMFSAKSKAHNGKLKMYFKWKWILNKQLITSKQCMYQRYSQSKPDQRADAVQGILSLCCPVNESKKSENSRFTNSNPTAFIHKQQSTVLTTTTVLHEGELNGCKKRNVPLWECSGRWIHWQWLESVTRPHLCIWSLPPLVPFDIQQPLANTQRFQNKPAQKYAC